MKFELPKLPYAPDALSSVLSSETIGYHYGKHEKTYIDNLNRLIVDSEFENKSLEDIIKTSDGGIFNNAAQVWNHLFYFFQFNEFARTIPEGILAEKIDEQFGSFIELKKQLISAGTSLFGSGWIWLSSDEKGNLLITQTHNADNPLVNGLRPILTIDVWEHAYYLDYQNRRADYLEQIWNIIDWQIIESRYV